MYDKAQQFGYTPNPTPKALNIAKCVGCGYCELGCITGAKWDSSCIYQDLLGKGITLQTNTAVKKVLLEGNRAVGVEDCSQRNLQR